MALFEIDPEKCKRDGLCVTVCPIQIIQMKDQNEVPSPTEDAEQLCINCGHCVAICPYAAIALKSMKPEDCSEVQKGLLPDIYQIEHFLRHRRSIRNYREKLIDRDIIHKLLRISSFAPSGYNLQPVQWLVIERPADVKHLASLVSDWMRVMMKEQPSIAGTFHFDRVVDAWEKGQDRILRSAPHLIVAHASLAIGPGQSACIIALTYLELAAAAMGLGACWAGYFNAAASNYFPLIKALDLPEGNQTFGAMMLGYRKYDYKRMPSRNDPKITWR